MPIEIKLPNLGDGIDSGDVLSILVAEGDNVQPEQGIVELETDKAVAEVPTTQGGRVTKIHVTPGQTVTTGDTLISIEPAEAAAATESQPVVADPTASKPPEPAPAESSPPQPAEPSSATAVPPVATQAAQAAPPPQPTAEPPAVTAPTMVAAQATAAAPVETPTPSSSNRGTAPAGPAVRRFSRELGVDLARVTGTGPGGRITKDDVRGAVRQATQSAITAPATTTAAAAQDAITPPGEQDRDDWGPVAIDRVTKIRATIATNMLKSKSTAPHVTNFDDADVTELEQIRQASKKDYADSDIKLTTMPFVIKAVAQALGKHPVINASVDLEARQIIYKQYVNVGVAVDTDRGLMVPVIRDANVQGIPQIARSLAKLAEKARTGKIAIEDMRGGTFTISNLGAIGGTYSTPVINVPEVAILLIGRSRPMPVVLDGEIQVRLMMPLSLSYDHRLVDGAAAARFLNEIKGYLEAPGRLLLAP